MVVTPDIAVICRGAHVKHVDELLGAWGHRHKTDRAK